MQRERLIAIEFRGRVFIFGKGSSEVMDFNFKEETLVKRKPSSVEVTGTTAIRRKESIFTLGGSARDGRNYWKLMKFDGKKLEQLQDKGS